MGCKYVNIAASTHTRRKNTQTHMLRNVTRRSRRNVTRSALQSVEKGHYAVMIRYIFRAKQSIKFVFTTFRRMPKISKSLIMFHDASCAMCYRSCHKSAYICVPSDHGWGNVYTYYSCNNQQNLFGISHKPTHTHNATAFIRWLGTT